jgi:diguanylate cyclase (GGDEF)-like protein/PAS domain S-box-containing protein
MQPDEDSAPTLHSRSEGTHLRPDESGPHAQQPRSPGDWDRAMQELQLHQIELEMQNAELRRTQNLLAVSNELYFDLYDQAPVGYCVLSEHGLILQANLTLSTLMGVERGNLVQQAFSKFICREDQDTYYLARNRLVKSGQPQSFELRALKADGTPIWVHLAATVTRDPDQGLLLRLAVSDITQRKQMELAQSQSEEGYRSLAEDLPAFVVTFLPDGTLTFVNQAVMRMVNMTSEALTGMNFFEFLTPDDRVMVRSRLAQLTPEQPVETHEQTYPIPGGAVAYHQWTNRAFFDARGHVTHFQAVGEDITARKLAQDELSIAAVAFECQNGMFITNAQGVILRVNQAFTDLTGYSAEESIGMTPGRLLSSGRQDSLFYQRMWSSINQKGNWQGEIWNRRKSGQIFAEMLTITAIASADRGVTNYVASFTDITEDKEAEAEIHRLAYYDSLTKLPNRRLLQDRLGQAVVATARNGHCGAIFFIDLDNFKALNDTRGHLVGDLLLVEIAVRLQAVVRQGDTVARLGGDEFVVLLEDLGPETHEAALVAKQLSEKLCNAIDAPFTLNGREYRCTLSIGIGLFDQHETVESLFKHADLALYQAKNAGRNTMRFFDPGMQATLDLRSAMEADLRQAITLQQLRLYYQPQVDAERRVVGCEALVRWEHPERGLVSPLDFIPLAEETGLILPIGLWVMETACVLLKSWESSAHTRELQLAVNVSARQFRQGDFVAQVERVLAASGVNPARLKFELTESVVLEDVERAIEKMRAIKLLGVSFSMDDFGTGYSSLSYLARLPLDQLKIDKSFVLNLPGNCNDATIARTIITMGQGLAMHVIAEGVETEEQRAFLADHGCNGYQGFLFSQPLPQQALAEFLTTPGVSN